MEDYERTFETPGISLPTEEGELILHYFNSRLRTFKDSQYDHIEYYTEDGRTQGIRVAQYIMDIMFENEYPMQFDPVVDEVTFEWFVKSEARILERELDEM